jgi:electron transport complex protein RnfG
MLEILRMILVLSIICALSGLTLASLRQFTAPLIEEQVLAYVQAPALLSIFVGSDNDPIQDRQVFTLTDGRTFTVFPMLRDGKLVAVALETFSQGYGGDIGVISAFNLEDDTILDIGMTTMKETPGLGTRVAEEPFSDDFEGHSLKGLALTKQGGDIDAVSGATISSAAAVNAVREATEIYTALKSEFLKTWS